MRFQLILCLQKRACESTCSHAKTPLTSFRVVYRPWRLRVRPPTFRDCCVNWRTTGWQNWWSFGRFFRSSEKLPRLQPWAYADILQEGVKRQYFQYYYHFQVTIDAMWNGCSQNALPFLHHNENAPCCGNSHKKCVSLAAIPRYIMTNVLSRVFADFENRVLLFTDVLPFTLTKPQILTLFYAKRLSDTYNKSCKRLVSHPNRSIKVTKKPCLSLLLFFMGNAHSNQKPTRSKVSPFFKPNFTPLPWVTQTLSDQKTQNLSSQLPCSTSFSFYRYFIEATTTDIGIILQD